VIDAVIFDMDGVLIDSEPIWQDVEMAVFGDLGVALTRDLCRQTMGLRVNEVVAYWRARHSWTGADDAEVERRIVDGVVELITRHGRLVPGAGDAIDFFASRVNRLAICSSSYHRVIDAVLERCGLTGRFAVVHSAEDDEVGKPDPAPYLSTARKLAVAPSRCLAIEDSPNGVAAAKAAGMRCIAIPEPGDEHDTRILRADLVLPSFAVLDDDGWMRLAAE